MAGTAFVARCGDTEIDLDQVGAWNDKNGDLSRSKDEFTYQDRYFQDEEWACYQKLFEKTGQRQIQLYHLNIPDGFSREAEVSIQQLLSVYSSEFDKGSLKISMQRSKDITYNEIDPSKSYYQVYYQIQMSATEGGRPVSDSVLSAPATDIKHELSQDIPKYTPQADILSVQDLERLLKANKRGRGSVSTGWIR